MNKQERTKRMDKIAVFIMAVILILATFACAWLIGAGETYEVPWYDVDPLSLAPESGLWTPTLLQVPA